MNTLTLTMGIKPETGISLNPYNSMRYYYLHFIGEDMEAQSAELGFVISAYLELGESTKVPLPLAMVEHIH